MKSGRQESGTSQTAGSGILTPLLILELVRVNSPGSPPEIRSIIAGADLDRVVGVIGREFPPFNMAVLEANVETVGHSTAQMRAQMRVGGAILGKTATYIIEVV